MSPVVSLTTALAVLQRGTGMVGALLRNPLDSDIVVKEGVLFNDDGYANYSNDTKEPVFAELFNSDSNSTDPDLSSASNDTGSDLYPSGVFSDGHKRFTMKLGFAERPSQALFEPMPINATLEDLQESTKWKAFLDRPECQAKITKFVQSDNPLYCRSNTKITWSAQYKFAYMRTPKVSDSSFEKYFRAQFLDAQQLGEDEPLPDDVFLFTFVRDPFEHALSGYQTVDHRMDEIEATGSSLQGSYTFRSVDRAAVNERYQHFLQGLKNGSFVGTEDKVDHKTAATQLSGIVCQTSAKAINFVGHMENLETDWRIIQHLAGIPMKIRTTAIQIFHESKKDKLAGSPMQLQVHMLSPAVYETFCHIYRVDYRCLGYNTPVACKGTPDSHDLQVPSMEADISFGFDSLARGGDSNESSEANVTDVYEF